MTDIKINKMLESTGGNLITLERIANDNTAPAEIRLTAFAAIDEKHNKYPVQEMYQGAESNNLNT